MRLLFTLGNLTARSDAARLELFQSSGCVATLLQLYSSYQRRDESPRAPRPPIAAREADDVLVKLVSVLANMCIHPAVGPSLVTYTTCIQLLMETLGEQSNQTPTFKKSCHVTSMFSSKFHFKFKNSFSEQVFTYMPGTQPLPPCWETHSSFVYSRHQLVSSLRDLLVTLHILFWFTFFFVHLTERCTLLQEQDVLYHFTDELVFMHESLPRG